MLVVCCSMLQHVADANGLIQRKEPFGATVLCCEIWKGAHETKSAYGVATISRLLKIIGLFCKRAL